MLSALKTGKKSFFMLATRAGSLNQGALAMPLPINHESLKENGSGEPKR